MQLITSEYSWEQVIHKIIAWEGLDPWDLDLVALSRGFMDYLVKIEELDFKVPAKYVIIAAVLLRMKSDHLQFIDLRTTQDEQMDVIESEIEAGVEEHTTEPQKFDVTPITTPPKRYTRRKIMVDELITALRRVLRTEERRKSVLKARGRIEIRHEDITERIAELYKRINGLLKQIKEEEVMFSRLVPKWEREKIIETFLPLVYLNNQGKVQCRQEELFKEIYIRR
jgi:segregation and condensation protein A